MPNPRLPAALALAFVAACAPLPSPTEPTAPGATPRPAGTANPRATPTATAPAGTPGPGGTPSPGPTPTAAATGTPAPAGTAGPATPAPSASPTPAGTPAPVGPAITAAEAEALIGFPFEPLGAQTFFDVETRAADGSLSAIMGSAWTVEAVDATQATVKASETSAEGLLFRHTYTFPRAALKAAGLPAGLVRERLDGVDAVRVTTRQGEETLTLWFAKDRGVVRWEVSDPSGVAFGGRAQAALVAPPAAGAAATAEEAAAAIGYPWAPVGRTWRYELTGWQPRLELGVVKRDMGEATWKVEAADGVGSKVSARTVDQIGMAFADEHAFTRAMYQAAGLPAGLVRERVVVPAGTYDAIRFESDLAGSRYTWWFAKDAGLVQYAVARPAARPNPPEYVARLAPATP